MSGAWFSRFMVWIILTLVTSPSRARSGVVADDPRPDDAIEFDGQSIKRITRGDFPMFKTPGSVPDFLPRRRGVRVYSPPRDCRRASFPTSAEGHEPRRLERDRFPVRLS